MLQKKEIPKSSCPSFMRWIDSIVNAAVVKFNTLGAPGKVLIDGRKRLSCDLVRMKVWNVQQKEAFLNITWEDNGNSTDAALIKGSGWRTLCLHVFLHENCLILSLDFRLLGSSSLAWFVGASCDFPHSWRPHRAAGGLDPWCVQRIGGNAVMDMETPQVWASSSYSTSQEDKNLLNEACMLFVAPWFTVFNLGIL